MTVARAPCAPAGSTRQRNATVLISLKKAISERRSGITPSTAPSRDLHTAFRHHDSSTGTVKPPRTERTLPDSDLLSKMAFRARHNRSASRAHRKWRRCLQCRNMIGGHGGSGNGGQTSDSDLHFRRRSSRNASLKVSAESALKTSIFAPFVLRPVAPARDPSPATVVPWGYVGPAKRSWCDWQVWSRPRRTCDGPH